MKLYLSSYQVGNRGAELQALVGPNKRAAVICNAIDSHVGQERTERVVRELDAMSGLGFQPEEVDLRDYFGKPEKLAADLSGYGLLWIRGGNVFVLRKAMRLSGFDSIVHTLLEKDIVYAGYSAGSCAAGSTLHGLELCDDIHLLPDGYPAETICDGLGLVEYAIAPHYESDHPESPMINDVVHYLKEHNIPHKTLQDDDAIVINN